MKRIVSLILLAALVPSLSACSKFFGDLRRDLDDTEPYTPPTYGGTWTERGMLSDEFQDERPNSRGDYRAVGHNERAPASVNGNNPNNEQGSSWVSSQDMENAQRDQVRHSNPDESGYSDFYNKKFKKGNRATRSDFIDESPNEGSLWASDGQTNYYFTKNKIRGIGDIVTVNIEANLLSDTQSEIRRTLTEVEKAQQIAIAQDRIKKDTIDTAMGITTDKNGNRSPAATTSDKKNINVDDIKIPEASVADIDISKVIELKAGDTMMAEIIQRYPNGNYKIRAVKNVKFKGGYPRNMQLIAIAKGSDIAEDDTILSGKLYEYRLQASR